MAFESVDRKNLIFPCLLPKPACQFQLTQGKKLRKRVGGDQLVRQPVDLNLSILLSSLETSGCKYIPRNEPWEIFSCMTFRFAGLVSVFRSIHFTTVYWGFYVLSPVPGTEVKQ